METINVVLQSQCKRINICFALYRVPRCRSKKITECFSPRNGGILLWSKVVGLFIFIYLQMYVLYSRTQFGVNLLQRSQHLEKQGEFKEVTKLRKLRYDWEENSFNCEFV